MPTKKETIANDELHRVTRTTVTRPRGRHDFETIVAMLKTAGEANTLEGIVGPADDWCRSVPADADPEPLSKPWYAERIASEIDLLRRCAPLGLTAAEGAPTVEFWIACALRLGGMMMDANWRFGFGDAARSGRRSKAGSERGKIARRVQAVKQRATRDNGLEAEVRQYRREHPTASVREIARYMRDVLDWRDVRGRVIPDRTLRRRLEIILGHYPQL